MINEFISPHNLTSEPSEHYSAVMRYLCREFTVNDLIYIVQKLIVFQVSVSNGDLKVARSTQRKVYVATVYHKNMKKFINLHSGIICVETDTGVIEAEKNIDNEASLENDIWNKLCPLLNSITNTMKFFLKNVCGVQEFHPMMDNYCDDMSVEEMARQVGQMAKITDNGFKIETQCANNKRDENDEN